MVLVFGLVELQVYRIVVDRYSSVVNVDLIRAQILGQVLQHLNGSFGV